MAQRTVKTYEDLVAAVEALQPGGKIILNPDEEIVIPEGEEVVLREGAWNIAGKTPEAKLTVLGKLYPAHGGSLLIQSCILNLAGPDCIPDEVEVKDVEFEDADLEQYGVKPEDEIAAEPEPEVEPEVEAAEPAVEEEPEVEETLDEDNIEEPEVSVDLEPEVEPEVKEEPKPTVEPKKAAEPKSQPASSGQSKRVSKVSVHLGPSSKSRGNTFSGSVMLTGVTATDALGRTWHRVTYKLPGSGRKAVGYIKETDVE